jgi:hypothetical protein
LVLWRRGGSALPDQDAITVREAFAEAPHLLKLPDAAVRQVARHWPRNSDQPSGETARRTEAALLTAALVDQAGTTVRPCKQEILDIDNTFCAAHGGNVLRRGHRRGHSLQRALPRNRSKRFEADLSAVASSFSHFRRTKCQRGSHINHCRRIRPALLSLRRALGQFASP